MFLCLLNAFHRVTQVLVHLYCERSMCNNLLLPFRAIQKESKEII